MISKTLRLELASRKLLPWQRVLVAWTDLGRTGLSAQVLSKIMKRSMHRTLACSPHAILFYCGEVGAWLWQLDYTNYKLCKYFMRKVGDKIEELKQWQEFTWPYYVGIQDNEGIAKKETDYGISNDQVKFLRTVAHNPLVLVDVWKTSRYYNEEYEDNE